MGALLIVMARKLKSNQGSALKLESKMVESNFNEGERRETGIHKIWMGQE